MPLRVFYASKEYSEFDIIFTTKTEKSETKLESPQPKLGYRSSSAPAGGNNSFMFLNSSSAQCNRVSETIQYVLDDYTRGNLGCFQRKSCSTLLIFISCCALTLVAVFSRQRGPSPPPLFFPSLHPPPDSPAPLSPLSCTSVPLSHSLPVISHLLPILVSTFLSTSPVLSPGNSVWDQGSAVVCL